MERRLDDIQKRLESTINHPWCRVYSNEIDRLSSCLSNRIPIYRTRLTREQLLDSIKHIQDLEISSQTNDLYRRSLANYLLLLSIHTHKLVCSLVLDHAFRLKHHLIYWQTHKYEFLQTLLWFDSKRDEIRISEKVKFLISQEDFLANIIGHLAYRISNLEQQDKFNLDLLMESTNELHRIFFEQQTVEYNAQSDLSDVVELYSQILNSFDEYQMRWHEKIQLYYRPTHFKRYLPYYICLSAIGVYTLYKIYSNKQAIHDYVLTSYDSLKSFANEHLVDPLKTIYTSTFHSRSSDVEFENSKMNYISSKKILEEMLENYGRQHATALAQINQTTVDDFLSTLKQNAINEDMNIVMKHYQHELDSPIRSAILGDLIKGILIQVQKVKVDGEGLVIQIDQLMKQNEINFSLLATIPAILLMTFFTIATKNFVANRVIKQRRYDLSTLRQRIIRKLREIEHVLILNAESPALIINQHGLLVFDRNQHEPSDQNDLIMSYLTYGHFLSLVYELKDLTTQLNSKRMLSKEFNEDINFLTYTQLTIQQKLALIQQISHSYSFLVHG